MDVLEVVPYAGRIWAIPYHTSVRGLFKRVDHFSEVGLDPRVDPSSLDQLYAWNSKLTRRDSSGKYTRAGMVPWFGNWGAPGWIWTFGGKLLDMKDTKIHPTANYVKNVEAFEWIRSWAQFFGTAVPVTAGHTGLQAGTVSMSAESTTSVGRLVDAGVEFTISRVPIPAGGQNGTWGGGSAIVVPVGVSNPQLSMKLARFFGETNVQLERFNMSPTKTLPANWQALLTVGKQLPKVWDPLLNQFPEARFRPPLWIQYYVTYLNPAMNQVVNGSKTPSQALDDVQTYMEPLYREIFGD